MNVNECELMIHRRTFVDDRYGVGEALDEQAFGLPLVARGKHLIFLGNQEEGNGFKHPFRGGGDLGQFYPKRRTNANC